MTAAQTAHKLGDVRDEYDHVLRVGTHQIDTPTVRQTGNLHPIRSPPRTANWGYWSSTASLVAQPQAEALLLVSALGSCGEAGCDTETLAADESEVHSGSAGANVEQLLVNRVV